MYKIFILLIFLPYFLFADFSSSISKISPEIKNRMIAGNTWKNKCPVSIEDLRYIRVNYYNFNGKIKTGELIMHKNVAKEITEIFKELYRIGYPIHRMTLVSDYEGNDYNSIENDNTSAFNCRNVTGGSKWSKHAYGLAIDINPIENPYLKKGKHSSHDKSIPFENRTHKNLAKTEDIAVLLRNDRATQTFIKRGWIWGGDWKYIKDYQHFQKSLSAEKHDKKSRTNSLGPIKNNLQKSGEPLSLF